MDKKYQVEIIIPGSNYNEPMCAFHSDSPFLNIQKGDIIRPNFWSDYWRGILIEKYPEQAIDGLKFRVTDIHHFMIHTSRPELGHDLTAHKIFVYTELWK